MKLIFFTILFSFSLPLLSQEKKSDGKATNSGRTDLFIFLGQTNILGGDLNKYLKSQSLEEKSQMTEFTFEGSRFSEAFGFGSRLSYMELYSKSTTGNSDAAYLRSINYLVAFRPYLFNLDSQNLSILLAGGVSWVELNVNQTVGVTKYDVTPLSIDPAAHVALTYSAGFEAVSFAVEGGYSWNEFKSLRQHEKFYATSLDSIDLSGWYLKSGLIVHIR